MFASESIEAEDREQKTATRIDESMDDRGWRDLYRLVIPLVSYPRAKRGYHLDKSLKSYLLLVEARFAPRWDAFSPNPGFWFE